MKDELLYIGQKIIQNKEELARNFSDLVDSVYKHKLIHQEAYDILEWRAEIIGYLGEALFEEKSLVSPKITKWAMDIGKVAVENGISLSQTLKSLTLFRTVIWEVFTEELQQRTFAPITMLDVSKIIDPFIDQINHIFVDIFEAYNSEKMKLAYTALEELSVPMVPLAKGIAVMPIVGQIDTHRAQLIMENALTKSAQMQLHYLIFDISGVLIVDTMVANNIFQIVKALQLIGTKTMITGIRPEIAQTMVSLGIELRSIKTRATLEQALGEIGFRKLD
ncbi:STAS domain-containing protein [Priestia aryabhattai]|uniref:STAS domain-containing protein n=1 Tax=Priestia aryabhattai TaxID=412384 RepID=UPI001C0DC856|nr:STAS domain-containing protein [Priestia aryabhattai]MBU3574128.1 STAS domain-containing protein [Priestia aryabhattai]